MRFKKAFLYKNNEVKKYHSVEETDRFLTKIFTLLDHKEFARNDINVYDITNCGEYNTTDWQFWLPITVKFTYKNDKWYYAEKFYTKLDDAEEIAQILSMHILEKLK